MVIGLFLDMSFYLHRCIVAAAAVLLGWGEEMATAGSANLTTLTSFSGSTGDTPDGANPRAGVLVGEDGFLYGTTYQGGTNGYPVGHGTIYKVSSAGITTTLWSFNNTNGAQPYAALASGDGKNLYGTTLVGGSSGLGTIFRISPTGSLTTLHSFDGANG